MEDETGILNVVTPKRFERQALLISNSPLLLIRGTLQVEHGVVNLRGEIFHALKADAGEDWGEEPRLSLDGGWFCRSRSRRTFPRSAAPVVSHDFTEVDSDDRSSPSRNPRSAHASLHRHSNRV